MSTKQTDQWGNAISPKYPNELISNPMLKKDGWTCKDNPNGTFTGTPEQVFVVHGYNVRDKGADTVNKFIPCLVHTRPNPVIRVRPFPYGWFGLKSVIFKNKKVAADLLKATQGFSHYAVGHSNGCAIIIEAARQGAKFKRVLLINPALPVDTIFPDTIDEVVVIYTEHDVPTRIARFFNKVPFIGVFVPDAWGAMGAKGAKNARPQDWNWNLSDTLKEHSDFFHDDNQLLVGHNAARALYHGKPLKYVIL